MTTTVVSILVLLAVLVLAGMVLIPVVYGAPWHWTTKATARRALKFADAQPGQTLVDLGSGDGRVVIVGAKEFGLNGVGLEIDPLKIGLARFLARRAGVADRVRFLRANVLDHDYRDADILFIYMTHQVLDRLFPKILDQLKPEAKIVCYRFSIRGMTPDKVSEKRDLFLYSQTRGQNVNRYS